MRRAIYEDDVIKLLDKGWKSGVYPVASNIHALPSVQPERKTGKWMREDGEHVEPDAICSACGFDWMWSDRGYFKFCPNCGARMDGGQDE